jgi:PKD repeat protein
MTVAVGQPNLDPVAECFSSLLGGPAPLDVGFDGTGSQDPVGTIFSYSWDFGDGNTGTGSTPSHVFAVPGNYTVALTVTDDRGATATAQTTVNVTQPLPFASRIGVVPDHESTEYDPLMLGKNDDGSLSLSWSATCMASDKNYAVYEGPLGQFSAHVPVVCSTDGLTGVSLEPSSGSTFYLVVAPNESYEGSRGTDSQGSSRPSGPVQCLPTAALQGCN